MVYLNVNGLDGFKFTELLIFMAMEAVDCMAPFMFVLPRCVSLFSMERPVLSA